MKSIVEEASSIAKAVEKGWVRAGKPQEFSVKIFEEPEKNFFGLTTKPAKIAIVFAQAPSAAKPAHEKDHGQRRQSRDTERRPSTHEARGQERRERHHDRRDDRQDDRQERRHERPDRQDRPERQERQERHGRQDRRPAREHQDQQPREQRDRDRSEHREQRPHDREQNNQQAPRQQHAESSRTWEQPAVAFAQTWITECLTHLGLPNVTAQLTPSGNALTIQLGSPIADNSKNERFFLSSLSHLLSEALRTQLKVDMRGLRIIIHSN
jgi:hypothetical protein